MGGIPAELLGPAMEHIDVIGTGEAPDLTAEEFGPPPACVEQAETAARPARSKNQPGYATACTEVQGRPRHPRSHTLHRENETEGMIDLIGERHAAEEPELARPLQDGRNLLGHPGPELG